MKSGDSILSVFCYDLLGVNKSYDLVRSALCMAAL